MTGGNLAYATAESNESRLTLVFTFDPWTETWTEQPALAHGRRQPGEYAAADVPTPTTSW